MEIGYARVSTREEGQAFNRQLDADEAASCDQAPADRGSGRRAPLPRLNACFEYRPGELWVVDLDRLGRRAGELIRFVEDREDRGVGFRALNAAFDTTTSPGAPPRDLSRAWRRAREHVLPLPARRRIAEGIRPQATRHANSGRQ